MACNFRADQYQREFTAPRLCNWQVPKWHPSKPLARTKPTKIISNDRGHLLPGVTRPQSNPWGHFKGTWQMPDKISQFQAKQLNATQTGDSRWARPKQQDSQGNFDPNQQNKVKNPHGKKRKARESQVVNGNSGGNEAFEDVNAFNSTEPNDYRQDATMCSDGHPLQAEDFANMEMEYLPGDFTEPFEQHPSRKLLEDQRKHREQNYSPPLELNDLYLEKHSCDYTDGCPLPINKRRNASPPILDDCALISGDQQTADEMRRDVTEKPGEWEQPPMVPAQWNFQAARKMAVENLEHQPLPDSIMDKAFRRVQAQGALNPGLALDVFPSATGVGVKTYMAGPTQCTKLKIYRPKTCGVVPKPLDNRFAVGHHRPHTCTTHSAKLGAMDLAIQWDYRPANPRDEPARAAHIDGTDASPGPAIFTVVKTPRTSTPAPGALETGGRSGGVFANTTGENAFFDRDIMRQAAPFGRAVQSAAVRSCHCDESAQQADRYNRQHYTEDALERMQQPLQHRLHRSRPRQRTDNNVMDRQHQKQRCKSSPNLSQVVNVGSEMRANDAHLHHHQHHHHHQPPNRKVPQKTIRLCEQYAQQPQQTIQRKTSSHGSKTQPPPFKSGTPNSNGSGTCISFDSGCGSSASNQSSCGTSSSTGCSSKTSVRVPKLRHPYAKRDYAIETLSPPFACWRGGAGQGGYPEHWRLASVYQHAYKPIEQRRRPLLATVYQ